jgi:hypothetical protein
MVQAEVSGDAAGDWKRENTGERQKPADKDVSFILFVLHISGFVQQSQCFIQ